MDTEISVSKMENFKDRQVLYYQSFKIICHITEKINWTKRFIYPISHFCSNFHYNGELDKLV